MAGLALSAGADGGARHQEAGQEACRRAGENFQDKFHVLIGDDTSGTIGTFDLSDYRAALMAKRKGKSRHRPKDWERWHREGHVASDDAETHRRLTQRRIRLPGQEQNAAIFADAEALEKRGLETSGVVVQLYPGGAMVRTSEHAALICRLAGTFRPAPLSSALAVGDQVTVEILPETRGQIAGDTRDLDRSRVDGLILQRAPRRTVLARPQTMRNKRRDEYETKAFEKVIAANMDQLVVVASVALPAVRRRLLDRYLIIAQRGRLPLVAVMNKIDLGREDEALMAEYAELGVRWVRASALTGVGLEDVRQLLAGRTSILAGASGVGKSSLLNAVVPGLNVPTREVRRSDSRGRHTTSAAVLYELPFGGQVIDTPGIRELGIEFEPAALSWYFPEFEPFAAHCRFKDCTHTHEPDCAVQAAVEEGLIASSRFGSYLRIRESMEE
jgi:ribosome biogenesis GTPase / thiamine phosphate phosphatase